MTCSHNFDRYDIGGGVDAMADIFSLCIRAVHGRSTADALYFSDFFVAALRHDPEISVSRPHVARQIT